MHDRTADANDSNATPSRWRRVLLNRWLLTGVSAVALYALLGFLLTPWIVKRYVSHYAAEKLSRKASITEVSVNPFLFTIEAKDFAFQEADDRHIFGFSRLFADFELSSLFRWAWTFADIRLERPSLHAEIQQNGRLNLADIADSLPKSEDPQSEEPPPVDGRPPRMLVQHAALIHGSFTFSDLSDRTPAEATFSPLNLELSEISTLPERQGPYAVKADLPGGGTIGWGGEISLHPVLSEGELGIAGFKLATAWKFAQDELNLAEPAGDMDFSARYRFGLQNGAFFLVLQDAGFALKKLVLTKSGKNTPLLALEAIEANGMGFDLQAQELTVPSIVVRDGKIAASVNEEGLFDWQDLVRPSKSAEPAAPIPGASTPESRPWRLKTGSINVANVALDYTDRSRAIPLALTAGGLNVVLNLSAEVGTGPVKANVDGLEVKLSRIMASEAGDDNALLSLDALVLNNGRIDIDRRTITITQVEATGGETRLVRDKDGRIRLLELFNPGDRAMTEREVIETDEKARVEGKPWSFQLDGFELDGYKVSLQDSTFVPDIVYDLKDIRVSLKNLTNDKKTPIDFDASLQVVQGGSASVNGQVSQTGDYADARAKLAGLSIKQLRPAVAKFTSLTLESGSFSASTEVKYHAAESGPRLSAAGSVSLAGLRLNEADTGQRLLEWKEISANGLSFELSPKRLQIEEVKLLEPGAKIVIFKDRSVNLAKVVKRSDATATETKSQSPQPQAPAVASQKGQTLFPLNIDRVRVEKGVVDFADFSLVLPFATRVTDFAGSVTGISSEPKSRASVKFDGRVDKYGLATVEGSLSPFRPKMFTDVSVLFRNVEMTPLTPYSVTFAGRKIASGKLNLNLQYKIQNSELLGENEVVLEKFTLGERVEAPDAIDLPLDLAIALLTDAEGKIDVAVPVRGNLDHPEFSYGSVIRHALVQLITKVVTAPFRALGRLFGGSGEEQMDAIAFEPGRVRLLPPEQEKLAAVSKALQKRPQLKLVVEGRFDTKMDGEALRTERARRALAEQMGVKPAPDEDPGSIVFGSAKTQKALEQLLEMRGGDNAVTDFKAQYERSTGKKAKRANVAMALLGLASSDTAFYEAMYEELVRLEPITDNDLKELATRRADAIVKELKTTHSLDDTRVAAETSGPVDKARKQSVDAGLRLDVIKPLE